MLLPIHQYRNKQRNHFHFTGTNISVVDVTGRQVMTIESDAKSAEQIDLSKLQSGTYFIRVATD